MTQSLSRHASRAKESPDRSRSLVDAVARGRAEGVVALAARTPDMSTCQVPRSRWALRRSAGTWSDIPALSDNKPLIEVWQPIRAGQRVTPRPCRGRAGPRIGGRPRDDGARITEAGISRIIRWFPR